MDCSCSKIARSRDILRHNYFDQIYDEHIYLFSVTSVHAMAAHFGFELVDAEHLPLHGGSIRYTVARKATREPSEAVADFLAQERDRRHCRSVDVRSDSPATSPHQGRTSSPSSATCAPRADASSGTGPRPGAPRC